MARRIHAGARRRGLLGGCNLPREARFEEIPGAWTGRIRKFAVRERALAAAARR